MAVTDPGNSNLTLHHITTPLHDPNTGSAMVTVGGALAVSFYAINAGPGTTETFSGVITDPNGAVIGYLPKLSNVPIPAFSSVTMTMSTAVPSAWAQYPVITAWVGPGPALSLLPLGTVLTYAADFLVIAMVVEAAGSTTTTTGQSTTTGATYGGQPSSGGGTTTTGTTQPTTTTTTGTTTTPSGQPLTNPTPSGPSTTTDLLIAGGILAAIVVADVAARRRK